MGTPPTRIRRRARRTGNQKPLKGVIMRWLRNASRVIFGRNVFAWLTDSKRQAKGTKSGKPHPSTLEFMRVSDHVDCDCLSCRPWTS